MTALGFAVNLSTLFGIVLAIGIIVDDAIVIVEAASRYIERGMSGHDSAVRAMGELFGPIVGITLVLMAVFLPAALLPSLTGRMLAQLAMVIAVTALISAINAAALNPPNARFGCARKFRPKSATFFIAVLMPLLPSGKCLCPAHWRPCQVQRSRGSGWPYCLRHWDLGNCSPATAFIPNEDQGYGMIAVKLPDGAALGRTVDSLNETTKIALATPGVKQVITIAGISVLDSNASLANASVNYVIFDDWGKRDKATHAPK